ncbi:MAG: alpha/beta fold hydrolase [Clostridium sp.]|nr:alpha/beta fold hydrolase [Clostridium sp.]
MKRIFSIILAAFLMSAIPTVFFGAVQAAPKKKVGYVNITYETKDNFVIKSKLFYPAKEEAVYPVVVMLHSLGYSGDYWASTVKRFVESGSAVLVMDLRGHGASAYDSNFRIKSWRYFSDKTFQKYPDDVADMLRYLASNYKNISTTKYAIVGADIGANTAVLAAEQLVNKPSCIVLISPTKSFKGLYTPLAIANIGSVPILAMASVRDRYSYNETLYLKRFAQGSYEVKTYPSGGMGMLMLKANPNMSSDIVNWVMPKVK